MEMEHFLKENGLETVIPTFAANLVLSIDLARKLSEDDLKELIPSVGQRIIFQNALRKPIEENMMNNNGSTHSYNFCSTSEESLSNLSTLLSLISQFLTSQNMTDTGEPTGNAKVKSYLSNITNSPTTSTTSNRSIASNNESITSNNDSEPSCQSGKSFDLTKNAYEFHRLPDFDLKTLVEMTPLGTSIIKCYEQNQILSNSKRTLLVDILMKKIFNYFINHKLNHSDYNILTAKILTLFPREWAGTYYVPAISKKNNLNNRPTIARGRLVDKYRNLLRIHRQIETDKRNDNTEHPRKIFDESMGNMKIWLSTRNDPWFEVVEKWTQTFGMRRDCDLKTVDQFFTEWPILNDPRAIGLIDMDFEQMFPEATINIHTNWFPFMEKLIEVKRESIRDIAILEQLNLLQVDELDEDNKVAIHLAALPHLVPLKSRIRLYNKKQWKFSGAEVFESILMHVKVPGDIESSIRQYREKLQALKQTVQPYIIIEGPTLASINLVYVVVDKVQYKLESLTRAVDLCFKLFHVLNASYPVQSEYLWILIQHTVYGISTSEDKVIPYIMDLIEHLRLVK